MKTIERVCVFCASSSQVDQKYILEAERLGEILSRNNIRMNYGGGAVGLMGAIANVMLNNNGLVTGVIPTFMVEVEWEHKGVKDMIHVKTMAERKQLLVKDVDAVIALPGSTGTLEELFEVMSNKKLGMFSKPIILVNTDGFYNSLVEMMKVIVQENFMRPEHLKIFTVVEKVDDVLDAIHTASPWGENAFKIASL